RSGCARPHHVAGADRRRASNHVSEKGQWRLQVLPPGDYLLIVETTPKFALYRDARITIGAGETVERTAVLQLAGITESIVVRGNSEINRRTSGLETRFGADFIRRSRPAATACSA